MPSVNSRRAKPRTPTACALCALIAMSGGHVPSTVWGAESAASIVKQLRQSRLSRIKRQAFGEAVEPSIFQTIEPAAGPTTPVLGEPKPDTAEPASPTQPEPEPPPKPSAKPVVPLPPVGPTMVLPPAAVPAASPGTTFRREPVEKPILEGGRWEELLYAVTLNGQTVSGGELVLRSPDGERLAVPVDAARRWRLQLIPDRILSLGGIPYYPLDALPDANIAIDEAALVLAITLAPEAFERLEDNLVARAEIPPPEAATGGFLDYDFILSAGEGSQERIDGLVEIGAFSPLGVGLTSVQFSDVGEDLDVIRLESTITKDFPDRRATLRIGDSLTTGGSFASSSRFAGIQWATNFATDPTFVTFPLPTIGGLSEQQSVIEVVSDNVSRVTTEVPAGPFRLGNIPVVTGAGELQVTVTDLLGREQTVTQPYYVSSALLKTGLHDFAYEAGFLRQDFGREGFEYGDPVVSTTHRYGISPGLTLEGHADADLDGGAFIVGGAAMLGGFGVVSGGIGASADSDLDDGYVAQLAYDYRQREFNLGARTRYTSEGFRTLGDRNGRVEREDQLNAGVALGDLARLGMLFVNREFHDGATARSITGSVSLPLLGGALIVNAAQSLEPDSETAVIAAFSMPLSRTRSIAAFAEKRSDDLNGRIQYRRNRDRSDLGLAYRLGAEYGDDGGSLDGRLDYNFSQLATSIDVEQDDDGADVRAGVAGSLALVDGKFGVSRPIGRSFGMVDLPGYPDVTIYLDNREAGKTNGEGRLLLPSLRPYQANKVSLELDDLPFEARVVANEAVSVPMDGAGVNVGLAIGGGRSAIATMVDANGAPLPAGMILRSNDGVTSAQIAREGLAQLDGIRTVSAELSGESSGIVYRCVVGGLPLDGEPFPELGRIQCAP